MKKVMMIVGIAGGVIIAPIMYDNSSVYAQQNNEKYQVIKRNSFGAAEHIVFSENSGINHENFIAELKKEFDFSDKDKLVLKSSDKDNKGFVHYKYKQLYLDIPVYGGECIIHEKNGKAISLNCKIYPKLSINTQPTITKEKSIENAMKYIGLSKYRWQDTAWEKSLKMKVKNPNASYYPTPELVIAPLNGVYKLENFRLCWKLNILGVKLEQAWTVFIDAHNGQLVNKINLVKDADVTATVNTLYNGPQNIKVWHEPLNSLYYLEEYQSRGPYSSQQILTYNMNNDSIPHWNSVTQFTSTTTNFSDLAANQVHFGMEKAYDFYYQTFSRNSFDGNGYMIRSLVHYENNLNNAFFSSADTLMVFGDGDGQYMTSVTSLDVAGHELTHAFIDYSSNLTYQGESGALNEAFADILGTGVEYFALGNNPGLWTIGENIMVSSLYLRSLSNPKSAQQPDTYNGQYWAPTGTSDPDHGGVHTNSGVANYWFYLLANGGSGTNDNGDSYNVNGIGIQNALDIAYNTVINYLTSNSDYNDARLQSIQAAQSMFGIGSPEEQSVKDAWCAVGVGPSPCNTVGVPTITNSNFYVYPNPSIGLFNVSFNTGTLKDMEIVIKDVLGNEVYKSKVSSKIEEIDLRHLSNGVYFLHINNPTNAVVFKIVIQK